MLGGMRMKGLRPRKNDGAGSNDDAIKTCRRY